MLSGWINNILAENLGTNSHVSENQITAHSKMGLVSESPIKADSDFGVFETFEK